VNEALGEVVIACDKREAFAQGSASDEAIHPSVMPCDGLLRFARNDVDGSVRKRLTTFTWRDHGSRIHPDGKFLLIFIDGIFTTFIEWPFTNVFDAIRENSVMSCV
jgi:hypothetical protein